MKLVVFRRVTPREALGRLLLVFGLAALGYAIWAPSAWAAAMGLMLGVAAFTILARRLVCETCGGLSYALGRVPPNPKCAKCGDRLIAPSTGGIDGEALLRLSVWLLLAAAVVLATWLASRGEFALAGLAVSVGLAGLVLTLRKTVCPQCGQTAIASSARLRNCYKCGAAYPPPEP